MQIALRHSGRGQTVSGSSGINWSSYWATRTPSGLVVTDISDSEIDGTFTINGTGMDGHYVYISTDNITFTLNQTLTGADNTFQTTGLTANTIYYFYIKAYKGTHESPASNTDYEVTACDEARALFAGMATAGGDIDPLFKKCYDDAILDLIADNNWNWLDGLVCYYAPNQIASLRNWVRDAFHGTKHNDPVFTAFSGWVTDAVDHGINLNYVPNTDKINLALNSCTLIVWESRIDDNDGTQAGASTLAVRRRPVGTAPRWAINHTAASFAAPLNNTTDKSGWIAGTRRAVDDIEAFLDDLNKTATTASTALSTYSLCSGGSGIAAGTLLNPTAGTHRVIAWGGGISKTQYDAFRVTMNKFFTDLDAANLFFLIADDNDFLIFDDNDFMYFKY